MARKNQSTFYGLNSKQTKHLLNRIKFAKGFDKKYRIISDFHRSIGSTGFSAPDGYIKSLSTQLSELGVFSLSEDPANILMWSHYGESHRGIALGFNPVEGSDLENPNMCRRVIYSSELSEFSFTDGFSASMTYYADRKPEPEISFRDTQVQRAIFTKTTDWEYEKEWRYIRSTEGAYDLPAPIAEVIFGAKCPAETREKYREIVLSTLGDGIKFREAFRPGSAFLELKDC